MLGSCAKLKLVGPLNLRTATETCDALREALAHHAAVSIDCTAATDIDLSFIQLLVAARSSAQQAGGTVSLAESPDGPLLAVLSRTGLRPVNLTLPGADEGFWFEGALI